MADIVEFSILFLHTLSIWGETSLSMIVFVFLYIWTGIVLSVFFYHLIVWILPHIFHFHLEGVGHTLIATRFHCSSHLLRLVLYFINLSVSISCLHLHLHLEDLSVAYWLSRLLSNNNTVSEAREMGGGKTRSSQEE